MWPFSRKTASSSATSPGSQSKERPGRQSSGPSQTGGEDLKQKTARTPPGDHARNVAKMVDHTLGQRVEQLEQQIKGLSETLGGVLIQLQAVPPEQGPDPYLETMEQLLQVVLAIREEQAHVREQLARMAEVFARFNALAEAAE